VECDDIKMISCSRKKFKWYTGFFVNVGNNQRGEDIGFKTYQQRLSKLRSQLPKLRRTPLRSLFFIGTTTLLLESVYVQDGELWATGVQYYASPIAQT
jgi:hypothetical protein